MRTPPYFLLGAALVAQAGTPGGKPRPAARPSAPAAARPAVPPVPAPPPAETADDGGAVVLELAVIRPGAPVDRVASGLFYLYPREPQPFKATFWSGAGKQARIVKLEFGLRKLPGAAPFAFELVPPRDGPARRIVVPQDPERTEMHAVWSDEARGDGALLLVRRATPGEAAVARARTRRLVRPSYRIRMRIDQEGGAARFLGSSELIAPLGESARESIENVSQRLVKRMVAPDPVAPAPVPVPGGGGLAAPTGDAAPGVLTTGAAPAAAPPAPTTAAPTPSVPDAGEAPREVEVPVDATDQFTVVVTADEEGFRLRWRVSVTGALARDAGEPLPVALEFSFAGYRHEKAVVRVAREGALYAYRLEFDPDWESESPAAAVIAPPPGYNSPPVP